MCGVSSVHSRYTARQQVTKAAVYKCRAQQDEVDLEDKEDQFQPQLGNVAFASAHDGWAFRISQLAKQYADKLGCNASGLEQALWGDYAFQSKTKRIIKIKADQAHKHKPLFVQVSTAGAALAEHIPLRHRACPSGQPVSLGCVIHYAYTPVCMVSIGAQCSACLLAHA